MRALDENIEFRQALSEDRELAKHLPVSELGACFSLETQLRHVGTIFARVFGAAAE